MVVVKMYLEISLELLWEGWSQFSFRVLCFSLYLFSRSRDPLQCLVNVKYRILICCTCHFQSSSFFVYFDFLLLQVTSVSNLCPDTRMKVATYLGSLVSCIVGRETLQTNTVCCHVWGVLSVDGPHWVCHNPSQRVLPRSPLLRLQGTVPNGPCILCTSQV